MQEKYELTIKNETRRSHDRSVRSKLVNLRTIYPTDMINKTLSKHGQRRTTRGNNIGFIT